MKFLQPEDNITFGKRIKVEKTGLYLSQVVSLFHACYCAGIQEQ